MNDNDQLSVSPLPYEESDIKSIDKILPYPTLIVTNENLCLNLEQTSTNFTTVAYFKPSLNSTLSNYYLFDQKSMIKLLFISNIDKKHAIILKINLKMQEDELKNWQMMT